MREAMDKELYDEVCWLRSNFTESQSPKEENLISIAKEIIKLKKSIKDSTVDKFVEKLVERFTCKSGIERGELVFGVNEVYEIAKKMKEKKI